MTPIALQDALIREMEHLFKEKMFLKPPKENSDEDAERKKTHLRIFRQNLSVEYSGDDKDPMPYMIVRVQSGKYTEKTGLNKVQVVIIMGIFDDSSDNQGYTDILNSIQKIYERFAKNPNLENKFLYDAETFEWTIQEDDYYPYYFGAATMKFIIPNIEREDPFT